MTMSKCAAGDSKKNQIYQKARGYRVIKSLINKATLK